MVSEKLIAIWKRKGNVAKLLEHGIEPDEYIECDMSTYNPQPEVNPIPIRKRPKFWTYYNPDRMHIYLGEDLIQRINQHHLGSISKLVRELIIKHLDEVDKK